MQKFDMIDHEESEKFRLQCPCQKLQTLQHCESLNCNGCRAVRKRSGNFDTNYSLKSEIHNSLAL